VVFWRLEEEGGMLTFIVGGGVGRMLPLCDLLANCDCDDTFAV
jgi:hypothetical protein